jgi:hypothetical protein
MASKECQKCWQIAGKGDNVVLEIVNLLRNTKSANAVTEDHMAEKRAARAIETLLQLQHCNINSNLTSLFYFYFIVERVRK